MATPVPVPSPLGDGDGVGTLPLPVTVKKTFVLAFLLDLDATVTYVSRKMGIGTARVLSYGFTGGRTVTISPAKLAGIGALAGFILSVFVCLCRAFRDDRILVPGDIRTAGLEVFAVVPGEE